MTKLHNKKGVTLLELIVAIGLFSLLILTTTGILMSVVKGQRRVINTQSSLDNLGYVLEVMNKELRMAQKDELGFCHGIAGEIYALFFGGQKISFVNSAGDCVSYSLEDSKIVKEVIYNIEQERISDAVTSESLEVSSLYYTIHDIGNQPLLTLTLEANPVGVSQGGVRLQSTISPRFYE